MKQRLLTLFVIGFCLAGMVSAASAAPLVDEVRVELARVLNEPEGVGLLPETFSFAMEPQLRAFYAQRNHAPAWLSNLGITGMALELLDLLRASGDRGLCSDHYHLARLEPLILLESDSLRHGVLFDAGYLALIDLLLTDAYLLYANDLSGWRVPVVKSFPQLKGKDRLVPYLEQSLSVGKISERLDRLEPDQPEYQALVAELSRLQELSSLGGWPHFPAGEVLRTGMKDPRLPQLRNRLFFSGDLEPYMAWEESAYGGLTEAGLRQFQRRHGLVDDGVLGPLTEVELNRPVEERIRQIQVNLQRWRSDSRNFGERFLRVNIAAFQLDVVEFGEIVMTMPVVVGTPYRKTPNFSAPMKYLEFAPYWYVPRTILREDKLPVIKRNPGWLSSHHYEILSWRGKEERLIDPYQVNWDTIEAETFPGALRQRPGPWNPLGRVKFMFPNRYAVYLHDTDSPQLFDRDNRLFSSGCIRVQRPLDLVQYLLASLEDWDCIRMIEAMDSSETLKVQLPEPVPVHLLYWTAWIDSDGLIQYRDDVYQRDADQEFEWQQRMESAAVVAAVAQVN